MRSDTAGRISAAIAAALKKFDIALYLPRAAKFDSEDVQRVLEYVTLALSLRDGRIDDLAVRALLELDENGIGETRIDKVMRIAVDEAMRFSNTIEQIGRTQSPIPGRCKVL